MKLNYQTQGSGQPLVILHGLFGSSDNWRSIAKQLADYAQVITVDLRNHGHSPHSTEQNYELMADDLLELIDELQLDNVDIMGHSVGGKVAMAFSQRYSSYCRKLIIVDIAPKHYEDEHNAIFKALLSLDLTLYNKRSDVDSELAKVIKDKAIRQFLLMNLGIENHVLSWRINLQSIFNNYVNLLKPVCDGCTITLPVCFIKGSRSSYILKDDELLIKSLYPNAEVYTIEQAGHWVHAEAPQAFLTKVLEFLSYD